MKTVACQTLNALVKTPHQWKKGPGVGKDMMPSQKDRCRELMTRIRIRELQPAIDDQDAKEDQNQDQNQVTITSNPQLMIRISQRRP